MIQITEMHEGKAGLCREVLDDLPEWFGIPESTTAYVDASAGLSMFAAHVGKQTVGFVSLKHHTEFASELYALGVKRRFHRQGAGRALIDAVEKYSRGKGTSFLTVKTLGPTNRDPHYTATRRFYEAVGFVSIEVFPTLWELKIPVC